MAELAGAGGLTVRTPPSGRPLDALAFRLLRRRLLTPAGAFVPGAAIHEVGGAPIGTDPAGSVLDTWGRCWDAANVFVGDGAAFPAGCWRNTTLTIVALAIRAAESGRRCARRSSRVLIAPGAPARTRRLLHGRALQQFGQRARPAARRPRAPGAGRNSKRSGAAWVTW